MNGYWVWMPYRKIPVATSRLVDAHFKRYGWMGWFAPTFIGIKLALQYPGWPANKPVLRWQHR